MAKLGTKMRSAKVYDKDYGKTAQELETSDITAFDSILQDISMTALNDQIQRFRPDFINQTADVMGIRFKDIILPHGTRFMRQGVRAAAFVIEVPPSVRTLSFKNSDDRTDKWSLALPYMYFIPVFGVEEGANELSALCIACRNKPLASPHDMLYCINLPNTYRLSFVPDRYMADGIIPSMKEMTACQGFIDTKRSTPFEPGEDAFGSMVHETITHFWSSRFTEEIPAVYEHMQKKEKRFKTLAAWQKASKKDPLFVLDVEYPPAICLDKLFDDIMQIHDDEETQILTQVNDYAGKIHDQVWREIQTDETYQKIRVNLNNALLAKFNEAMKRFSASLAANLSSINNETMKRHILLAITCALRDAVK